MLQDKNISSLIGNNRLDPSTFIPSPSTQFFATIHSLLLQKPPRVSQTGEKEFNYTSFENQPTIDAPFKARYLTLISS